MIENDTQLKHTRQALGLMESALADLKRRVASSDTDLFMAMAASHLKDIDRMRQEIDEYQVVLKRETISKQKQKNSPLGRKE